MQNELYENVTDTKHQSLEFRETNLKWTAMVTYLDSGIEVNQSSPWKLHSFSQCFEEELVDKTACLFLFKLYDKHLEMKNVTASKKSK